VVCSAFKNTGFFALLHQMRQQKFGAGVQKQKARRVDGLIELDQISLN
jgi:hypothetical protein